MTKKADSFIVAIDDDENINVIDKLEMNKYRVGASKAEVDPKTGSKQVPPKNLTVGKNIQEPKYNPDYLVDLLDIYSYHEMCVNAVSTDAGGINYDISPIMDREPIEAEKKRFMEILDASKPGINTHIRRCLYDRRSIGYGAIEVIRESVSESPITRLNHIPAHTLRRHYDEKRVLFQDNLGNEVWYVIYGKNYDENGNLCDVHADTGEFYPYNSLSEEKRANELLWTMQYAPGTSYYGRPPIIAVIPSIQGDLSAVAYNVSFFKNMGMPKFAVTVTGDFIDYDEEPYIEGDNGEKIANPNYDETQTLRYKIGEQIKQIIKHPHSALCVTIPSEGEEGNVEIKITPLSVQTEDGHFRMYRKDIRDECIHSHQVDPSRLGIFDAGNLNGTNSENTKQSYKYGTITTIKADAESMINQLREELEITSWEFKIVDVDPIDYSKDIELADFLFARGAMTIIDLIDNFGEPFGLSIDNRDDPYLTARYINGVPLERVWSNEENPYREMDSILGNVERKLRGEQINGNNFHRTEKTNIGLED